MATVVKTAPPKLDLARALRACKASGLQPTSIVVEPGRAVLRFGGDDPADGGDAASGSEWDVVLAQ